MAPELRKRKKSAQFYEELPIYDDQPIFKNKRNEVIHKSEPKKPVAIIKSNIERNDALKETVLLQSSIKTEFEEQLYDDSIFDFSQAIEPSVCLSVKDEEIDMNNSILSNSIEKQSGVQSSTEQLLSHNINFIPQTPESPDKNPLYNPVSSNSNCMTNLKMLVKFPNSEKFELVPVQNVILSNQDNQNTVPIVIRQVEKQKMDARKRTQEDKNMLRQQIIELYEQGKFPQDIASDLGIAKTTVWKWIKRYRETGTVETLFTMGKANSGRVRKTSTEEDDLIFNYICGIPVDEIKLSSISICYTTLRKRIHQKYEDICQSGEEFPDHHKDAIVDFLFNKGGPQHPVLEKVAKKYYVCKICGKTFKGSYAKTMHEKTHSDVREFPCQYCEKMFKTPRNVKIHERLHTGEVPYQCRWCDRKFVDLANCYKHIGRIHKSEHERAKRKGEKSVIRCNAKGDEEEAERLGVEELMQILTPNNLMSPTSPGEDDAF